LSATVAEAAPCGQPDVDHTFPPHAAEGVPPNATLAAHYSAPADFDDEAVTLTGPAGDVIVDVSYDPGESMLRARPRSELVAGPHRVSWPALRGVSAHRGLGKSVDFTAGATRDQEAPRFAGLTNVEWDLSREEDPCTESTEDRFWFDLGVGSATDDVSPDLLAVVVFETRGGDTGKRSSPEQIAVLPFPEGRVLRVERQAIGDETVCFAAVTRDLTNRVSGGGENEVCVETTKPPFFDGCSITRRRSSGAFASVTALALVLLRRRWKARDA
jgi:hypothetical protein